VRNGSSGGKKRLVAAILHNDRYGHAIGGARKCHNYALCNLAWGDFWRERLPAVGRLATALYFFKISTFFK